MTGNLTFQPYRGQRAFEYISDQIKQAILSKRFRYIMFVRSIMGWATRKLEGWIPSPDEQRYSYISHKEMFDAIVSRDVKLAQRLMFEHIEKMGILVSHRGKK